MHEEAVEFGPGASVLAVLRDDQPVVAARFSRLLDAPELAIGLKAAAVLGSVIALEAGAAAGLGLHMRSADGTWMARLLWSGTALVKESVDQGGRRLRVEKLPMPKPLWLDEEQRYLPASYANFYIGKQCVLLPVFKDRNDKKAIDLLKSAFPDREVVQVPARALHEGGGGPHCITQQIPLS